MEQISTIDIKIQNVQNRIKFQQNSVQFSAYHFIYQFYPK